MAQINRSSTFRPDIEGLRGIAVLMVVAFHCGIPGVSGGFVGVDVFFVLSGYLITGLLVAEIQKTSKLNLLQFYARRIRRLLPASALMLMATLLAGMILMAPNELAFAGRAARATALYASNIFFSLNAADYFAPDVKSNPMLHTWSLAVEEQFYFFWPLLIMLCMEKWRSKKALIGTLSGLTIVSLALSVWFTVKGGTFAFYQLPARAWEFGIGGLAVLIPRDLVKLPSRSWLALGWFGLLAILGAGHFILGNNNFPGWIALIPVLGTVVALIAGSELPDRGIGVVLDSRPLQTLGSLSYSWYLWHWPFLIFSSVLFPNIAMAGKIAAGTAALAVAAIAHQLVENPIRFHPQLIKRPVLSLYLGVFVTLGSLCAAFISIRFAARLAKEPTMTTIAAAVDDISTMPRKRCVTYGESPEVKACSFGDESSATHIVLFGDSHAIGWFDPIREIAEARGWKLTTIIKSGCIATDVRTPSSDGFAAHCSQWRTESIRRIAELRPSIVFMGNATNYLGRQDVSVTGRGVSSEEWRAGTRRTFEALAAAGLRVAFMRDNPSFKEDIPTCLARSVRHAWYPNHSCDMDESTSLNAEVFEAEKAAAAGLPNIHIIDLTDRFCPEGVCRTVENGAPMYRDNNHLTGHFSESLKPAVEANLLAILKTPN